MVPVAAAAARGSAATAAAAGSSSGTGTSAGAGAGAAVASSLACVTRGRVAGVARSTKEGFVTTMDIVPTSPGAVVAVMIRLSRFICYDSFVMMIIIYYYCYYYCDYY
jgi:hypothetical protein